MADEKTISKINGYTIKDGVLRKSFNGALETIEGNFDALEDAITDINDQITAFNKKTFYWANIPVSGSSNTGTSPTFSYVYPSANNSGALGTSSSKWGAIYGNNIYGTTIYENGTSLANKYGVTVTPSETSGTKIADIKVGTTTKTLYVPATAGNYLPLTGGTVTGDIYLNTNGGETDRKIGTELVQGNQFAYINFEGGYGGIDILGCEQVALDGGQNKITLNSNGVYVSSGTTNMFYSNERSTEIFGESDLTLESTAVYVKGAQGDAYITLDQGGITLDTTKMATDGSITLSAADGIYMDSGHNGALEFTEEGVVVRDAKGIASYGDIEFKFFDDGTSATEHRISSKNSYIEFCDDDAEFNIKSPSLINIEAGAIALRGDTEIQAGSTLTLWGTSHSNAANIKFGTINGKTPYIGYATNQSDGTFSLMSIEGTTYESGLAIGGSSGNLLWKGTKVATVSDIQTPNNGTLTIQKNGTTVQTFSANQSGNVTANITVPTKLGDLSNDKGYATTTEVNTALATAKSYTDTKVANLVGSAPDTLDTLEELADALRDNADIVTVLENSIASKADKTALDSYVTLSTVQTISGQKTFTGSHLFTGETKFTNGGYCPNFSDIASGIGKSSCFTRGAHMQVITGQILAPTAGYTDATRGYNTETGTIKFQRITSSANGQPAVSDMATLTQGMFTVPDGVIEITNGDAYIQISAQTGISHNLSGEIHTVLLPAKSGYLATTDDIKTYSFSASNPTLAWGTTSTIGTAGGTTYKVTMPANPNTDTGATSVAVSGSGNAVTAASYDTSTRKLTLTKGATFLTSHQSLANYVTTNTTQTITGSKTFSAPTNVSGSEQVTTWFNTANGGRVGFGKEAANSGTGIFFDQVSGTRRLNFRASATAGAMVWEQPEKGAQLYFDIGAQGSDYKRIALPSSAGTLALTSQIPTVPTKLSSFTNDSGFTTNKGTVTSVTINGTNVTPDSNGLVNLGTISGGSGGTSSYVLPTATSSTLGGVKTGSNITNSNGTISLTKANVTSALGYTPMSESLVNLEMNNSGSLKSYGGFIDFHFHNSDGKPTDSSGTVVTTTPDYTSRIIENAAGQIDINGVKFKSSTVTGSLSGNASTATKLATARTLSFTNDATGSMAFDGSANASATLTLKNSGVTAGSYGPSANASPAHGGTFSVPYITVDAKGRVTSASTKTITVPSVGTVSNATYASQVKVSATSSSKHTLALLNSSSQDATSVIYDTGVQWDSTNKVLWGSPYASRTAGTYSGNSSTTATTQTLSTGLTTASFITVYAYESTKGTAGDITIYHGSTIVATMTGEAAYHGQQYLCCSALLPKGATVKVSYKSVGTVYYHITHLGA